METLSILWNTKTFFVAPEHSSQNPRVHSLSNQLSIIHFMPRGLTKEKIKFYSGKSLKSNFLLLSGSMDFYLRHLM